MKLSIVIPTYKEKENLAELIPAIRQILSQNKINYEIIIVDDNSQDGTQELIKKINKKNIKLLTRINKRGLSSAVFDGLMKAEGDILCFMDADFSHPPDALPGMFKRILKKESDIVVGSRLAKGGGMDEWPLHRVFTSWVARMLARPLTPVKDVTSGFFMFRKEVVPKRPLNLPGFKIGLELLVKGDYESVSEYPIIFQDRKYGTSKLSSKVILEYIRHLRQLYAYRIMQKFKIQMKN